MEKLQSWPFEGGGAGRPQKYPWEKWEDGSVWKIARGEDYEIPTQSMQVNLHLRASKDNLKVRTRTVREDDGEKLVFQFMGDRLG
ncbi:MAG: hypothetical protein QOC77_2459 [Thermoleophilaceae bacterium]|nr:hypothetical protein [Thermoleophilaceae bacterium]MEA2427414.1 hypothetical protein [Thermoleophilaceae bacterium]